MSSSDTQTLYMRLLAAGGVILAAAVLGLILGSWSVSAPEPTAVPPELRAQAEEAAAPVPVPSGEDYVRPDAPPLYFHSGGGDGDAWRNTLAEMGLAAAEGIHQHIFRVDIPWPGAGSSVKERFDDAVLADPMGAWLLEIDLNPPATWIEQHATGVVSGLDGDHVVVPAYDAWREAVAQSLEQLFTQIERTDYAERVLGVVLRGMLNGEWQYPEGGEVAFVERDAYRNWLSGVYVSDASLQTAWKDNDALLREAEPVQANGEGQGVLLSGNATQRIADFRRFRAESIADMLASLAATVKAASGEATQVLVAYGYSFDARPDAGHGALGILLGSDIDGFVSPVSEADRGVGNAGGFTGPVDSAGHYGKTWVVIDNLRTGVTRDPRTGAVERLRGLRPEDIYKVQRRNFGAALVHGLGVAWSDPEGNGWLHDEAQWRTFASMQTVYQEAATRPEGEVPASGAEAVAPVGLMVVIDEAAGYFAQNDEAYLGMLQAARDAALRSGVSVRFVLLQDVLDEITPPALSYLFVNAYVLDEADRAALHARLSRESACAIWYYAPGFRADRGYATDNVTATVRMPVERFDEPLNAGSLYTLSGGWVGQEEAIGPTALFDPLFFIDDNAEAVDVLARYRDGGKPSVATRYIEDEGWTTVFIAEPGIGPGLLREILNVNEQLGVFQPTAPVFLDAAYISDDYLVVHGNKVGERAVQLGGVFNVTDCFDAAAGWPERDGFLLPLDSGETRVLKLEPL